VKKRAMGGFMSETTILNTRRRACDHTARGDEAAGNQ